MQQRFAARDIQGLTPGIELTRSTELFVLDGSNYVFDSIGPYSGFSDRKLLPQPLGDPAFVQGVRLKLRDLDRSFVITTEQIMEWDESFGGWRTLYITPSTRNVGHRWTTGYVNGKQYFCHPLTGILVYDLLTGICQKLQGLGVPEDAIAIAADNGRLIAITPELFMWSGQSDGSDFDPRLGGAGFQIIADWVSGDPILVTSYGQGTLTWTTGGVMRSEFTGDASVYRHRNLDTEYRPINSFCSVRVDEDTVVILDERGLFKSKGDAPEPYSPVFNEYLIGFLQDNAVTIGDNCRIEWDELRRKLYVSISDTYASPLFETCFVLYPPMDKWGQFNESHYGILPITIQSSQREGRYFGYVDSIGCVRYWRKSGSREADSPEQNSQLSLFYPQISQPAQYDHESQFRIVGVNGVCNTIPSIDNPGRAGWYEIDAVNPAPASLVGLNSVIRIGLWRIPTDQSVDELTEITNVMIRSNESGPKSQLSFDFNLLPDGGRDYNLTDGHQDYGLSPLNYVNHNLRLIGTIDGNTPFDISTPILDTFIQGARYYTGGSIGLWHIIELSAVEVGESLHPRTVEITATYAGKLM